MNEVRFNRMKMLFGKLIVLLFILIDYVQSINDKENPVCLKPYEDDIEFWIQTVHTDNKDEWISEGGITHPESTSASGWNIMIQRDTIFKENKKYYRVYATVSPKPFNGSCHQIPDGYKKARNEKFYKFHENKLTWYDAKNKCEEELSHLAIPETDQDLEIMLQFVNEEKDNWVGITDNKIEGNFLDIFGRENKWWTNRIGKYDDKDHHFNCGIIVNKLKLNPLIFTKVCDLKSSFICQYNIVR